MEKIKTMQPLEYDYRVFCTAGGEMPMEVLHMVPMMVKGTTRYENIISLDLQGKTKNMYDWDGSGFNSNNKLQNFCDALTLVKYDSCMPLSFVQFVRYQDDLWSRFRLYLLI